MSVASIQSPNSAKILKIGIEKSGFSPFVIKTENKLSGYDVEVLTLFAQSESIELQYIEKESLSEMLSELEKKPNDRTIDLAIGCIEINDKRLEQFKFTPAVSCTRGAGFTTVIKNSFISTCDDLNKQNVRFIVVEGVVAAKYAMQFGSEKIIEVAATQGLQEKVLELGQQGSDYIPIAVDDGIFCAETVANNKNLSLVKPDIFPDNESTQNGFAFPMDDMHPMYDKMSSFIVKLSRNGYLIDLRKKYRVI